MILQWEMIHNDPCLLCFKYVYCFHYALNTIYCFRYALNTFISFYYVLNTFIAFIYIYYVFMIIPFPLAIRV